MEPMTENDLLSICHKIYPSIPVGTLQKLLQFNSEIQNQLANHHLGLLGQSWEFNLRDVLRWCQLMDNGEVCMQNPDFGSFVDLLYVSRFRTEADRQLVWKTAVDIFGKVYSLNQGRKFLRTELLEASFIAGRVAVPRVEEISGEKIVEKFGELQLLQSQSSVLEKLAFCVANNFVSILVGSGGAGKTALVDFLAAVTGHRLEVMCMNSATDASELLGSFEQRNPERALENLKNDLEDLMDGLKVDRKPGEECVEVLAELEAVMKVSRDVVQDFTQDDGTEA